jgi:hypothetical protein
MFLKVKLALVLTASVAGGGAVAANHAALFEGSGPPPEVAATHEQAATVDATADTEVEATVSTPVVPQAPAASSVTPAPSAPSIDASAEGSGSVDASATVGDPAGASADTSASASASASVSADLPGMDAALDMVKDLQARCPSLVAQVWGAAKELTARPMSASTVFQVTGTTQGGANTSASLLVDVSAHTVTSTDPVTAAALSACEVVAEAQPGTIGRQLQLGVEGTLTIGG